MSVSVDVTHNNEVNVDISANNSTLVCRGCLKRSGEMKNIYEWGLDDDFFTYTDIPRNPSEGMPVLLCGGCEADLQDAKNFKNRCQQSDKILRSNLKKTNTCQTPASTVQITSVLRNKKLLFLITAPNPEDKILLKCPHKLCNSEFYKKTHLVTHLQKSHNISADFQVEQQFFCTEQDCVYKLTTNPTKYFTGRKYLNQHYNKIHNDKIYSCESCDKKFAKEADYNRHIKTCNLIYVCSLCNIDYTTKEAYLVHLMRRHPELHAKYKEEKKSLKRQTESNEKVSEETHIPLPTKIRKETDIESKILCTDEEIRSNKLLERRSINKVTKFPPLQLNMDVSEYTIPPAQGTTDVGSIEIPYVIEEQTIDEELVTKETDAFVENLTVAEDYTIEAESGDEEIPTLIVESVPNPNGEDSQVLNSEEQIIIEESHSNDGVKKSSATQIPEDISDASFTAWSNRNDLELQNEMSTQTVFEDLLSIKSQHSEDEMFFSESVSLSDIQTQTEFFQTPLEFGLGRCNKETQSCTSQTQSPDLSIKETQTCLCLYDSPRHNFRLFDSLSSSPASSHFISTETQTAEFRTPVRSDVLLSFSSAETQTCFDESSNVSM